MALRAVLERECQRTRRLRRFERGAAAAAMALAGKFTPVACPAPDCDALVGVPLPADGAAASAGPRRVGCAECRADLCATCCQPWAPVRVAYGGGGGGGGGNDGTASRGVGGFSHDGRTCDEFARQWDRQLRREQPVRGAKECPNARCGRAIVHYRGHSDHLVACGCGLKFCFNCLASAAEIADGGAHWCSMYCSDLCGCESCPECAPGKPCGFYCEGRCPACAGAATEAEVAVLPTRRAEAVARQRALHPDWPGPRSERADGVVRM